MTLLSRIYKQGVVVEEIDFAGDALGEFPNQLPGGGHKKHQALVVGHVQTVLNIRVGLFFLKRVYPNIGVYVTTDADPLSEPAEFRQSQLGLQLRLAAKNNFRRRKDSI